MLHYTVTQDFGLFNVVLRHEDENGHITRKIVCTFADQITAIILANRLNVTQFDELTV